MSEFFGSIYHMFTEAAFYLMIGFGVAGLLRYVLSEGRFLRWFGRDDFGSVILASLLGVPLPLCSCSVLPVAVAMKKRGASRGAVTSFLISTPETGVDSIFFTYAILDPILTVVRPLAALVTALFTGSAVNWFSRRGLLDGDDRNGDETSNGKPSDLDRGPAEQMSGCSCSAGAAAPAAPDENQIAGSDESLQVNGTTRPTGPLWLESLRFGYITLLNDLVSVLCFAFLCAGLIAVAVPDSLFDTPLAQGFPAMLIMLVVGIPFYICATASTPIAATLLLKGLSPGAALVFLLAGPATNLGSLFALSKYLGKRTLALYLVCVAVVTLFMGLMVDSLYRDYGVDPTKVVGQVSETIPFALKAISAVALLVLLVRAAWVTGMLSRWGKVLRRLCRPLRIDPLGRRARAAYVLLALLCYASTCFSVVDVGEVGWVQRFGKVTRSIPEPGLCWHLPAPFERVRVCRPLEVRTLEFGFERGRQGADLNMTGLFSGSSAAEELTREAEVMNGGESIVSIKFSVQYRLKDAYRYTFHLADPEQTVRSFAASALRLVCSCLSTDRILVGYRAELEERTRIELQVELDRAGTGVEILKVNFLDVHAPRNVHYAFRDVASAAEDKQKEKLQAESDLNETIALARGQAHRLVQDAWIYHEETVAQALGRGLAFRALCDAYGEAPALTRLRLYLETVEAVLATTGAILPLGEGIEVQLWMGERGSRTPFLDPTGGDASAERDPSDGGRENARRGEIEPEKSTPFRDFWEQYR